MAARERLTWERDALRAGMDTAEVERRRTAEERLHEAAEDAQEAIERERAFVSLLLESSPSSEAESKAKRGEHPLDARLAAFRLEVSRALRTAGESSRDNETAERRANALGHDTGEGGYPDAGQG